MQKRKALALSAALFIAMSGSAFAQQGGEASAAGSPNPYNILNYAPQSSYNITIKDTEHSIQGSKMTAAKGYETDVGYPGGMIIVDKNEALNFTVTNTLKDATSVHWHGLKVPNDQDGPGSVLQAGERAAFAFKLDQAGTNWYHPHERPILPQLNTGLYAPFIVKDDFDDQYAGDYVLVLDDWALAPSGAIDDKYSVGDMEILGNKETVNGRSGEDIYPVSLKKGEVVKLRFINASTAQSHTLALDGHEMRVTHLDGYKLLEPYTAGAITLFPGERVDVEVKGIKTEGTYYINNERNFGMSIPVVYEGVGEEMASPFVPDVPRAFAQIDTRPVDFEFVLNSKMERGSEHGAGMSMDMEKIMWTINDMSYPDMKATDLKVGQVYKFRFTNNDTEMMHAMSHPIHIHGEHFQVVSINGTAPASELFKDTMEVKPGEYVDIAIRFDNPGMWMLHCHIIDHEDNGMLTVLNVMP